MAPDAKERRVIVTLELMTKAPRNELRVAYRSWLPMVRDVGSNRVHLLDMTLKVQQVHVQAARPTR